jgi:glyoxylase-like metal-dependent hydrolase (beta-lactamase superfamily II)
VVETPGHASDHVAFSLGDEAVIGDVARASGSVVIAESGDVRAYLTTLRRLLVRDFSRLHPGHGPPIDDPTSTLTRLLGHRLAREAMVEAAVRDGATTAGEIVDAVYGEELGDARALALLTTRAHLRKLAVEGDVAWDGRLAAPG